MIYNTIEDQKLTHANQLTIYAWNRIINILKTQANNNSHELEHLINWLGFKDVKKFEDYINEQLEGLRDSLAGKMDERTILERVVSDSNALVTSKGIYDAIPRISFIKDGDYLSNIKHNNTDYPLPIHSFNIKTEDGFMSEYKVGDDTYKVLTPTSIPKTNNVADEETLITSKGVYNEFNKYKQITSYTKEDGNLTGINFKDESVSVPNIPFTVFFVTPNTDKVIYGFQIKNDIYKFVSESNITVDHSLNSSSTNPVENRVIYNALDNKVEKEAGKKLSTNDFTNEYKTKLDGLENYDDTTIKNLISNAQTTATEAKNIAQGRSSSFVFETFDSMVSSLETVRTYKPGDNLYIKALKVPDYWVYAVHNTTDEDPEIGRYGYYTIAQLETQKVDLTDYPTTDDMNTAINNAIGVVLNTDVEE